MTTTTATAPARARACAVRDYAMPDRAVAAPTPRPVHILAQPAPLPGEMGTDLLLKHDGGGGFQTMAALRQPFVRLSHDRGGVLLCRPDDGRWQRFYQTVPGAQVRIGGLCTFADVACRERALDEWHAGAAEPWRIAIPGSPAVSGLFRITALHNTAPGAGQAAHPFELASHGRLTIGPV